MGKEEGVESGSRERVKGGRDVVKGREGEGRRGGVKGVRESG